jgi:hypothetical protein
VSVGSIQFINSITWNEYDNQFVLAGGQWAGGTIDARILTSPDGTTWTARETGSTKVALNNVKGDNAGNYIATGTEYSSSAYRATTVYMYSTDNAVTWTAGTLPATIYVPYAWADKLTWGDIKLGL